MIIWSSLPDGGSMKATVLLGYFSQWDFPSDVPVNYAPMENPASFLPYTGEAEKVRFPYRCSVSLTFWERVSSPLGNC